MSADIARDRLEWILGFDHRHLSDKRGAQRDSLLSQRGFKAGRGPRLRWPQQVDEQRERQLGKSRDRWTEDDRLALGLDREAFNETGNAKPVPMGEVMIVRMMELEKEIGKPIEQWAIEDLAGSKVLASMPFSMRERFARFLDVERDTRLAHDAAQKRLEAP